VITPLHFIKSHCRVREKLKWNTLLHLMQISRITRHLMQPTFILILCKLKEIICLGRTSDRWEILQVSFHPNIISYKIVHHSVFHSVMLNTIFYQLSEAMIFNIDIFTKLLWLFKVAVTEGGYSSRTVASMLQTSNMLILNCS